MSPDPADTAQIVRDHIFAFNAQDLDRLMACFGAEASWVTGTDRYHGRAELAAFFASAFAELSPTLTVTSILSDGDRVACELREQLVAAGTARVDHIAGFYQVEGGKIVEAKIYREGSARV